MWVLRHEPNLEPVMAVQRSKGSSVLHTKLYRSCHVVQLVTHSFQYRHV